MRAFSSGVSFYYLPEIVCFYEGGGVTSDHTIFVEERQNYLEKYFNPVQRILYKIRSIFQRILNRIIRFDMSIPHFLKKCLFSSVP
jgi:GT2 family glycosyltransferase